MYYMYCFHRHILGRFEIAVGDGAVPSISNTKIASVSIPAPTVFFFNLQGSGKMGSNDILEHDEYVETP